jgi:N-acetylglutamate synthase-like GNAT family acetyltransferase
VLSLPAGEYDLISTMTEHLKLEVTKAKPVFDEVTAFYTSCGRSTSLNGDDFLIVARSQTKIVAVVRLCFEHDVHVLRTMQVKNELQGKGIGRRLLNRFLQLINDFKLERVYCVAYEHLEYFYGLIGFQKIESTKAPSFLVRRAEDFHKRNSEKKVILMAREKGKSMNKSARGSCYCKSI